jgi:hypothetical protein
MSVNGGTNGVNAQASCYAIPHPLSWSGPGKGAAGRSWKCPDFGSSHFHAQKTAVRAQMVSGHFSGMDLNTNFVSFRSFGYRVFF